ncbi:hypothetical protein JQX13_32060 [Archangium violaceum]|uniref:hypothetical protein n=1 Tax=Archangium violaceum TaxID=83451 RepID=UPI00193BFEC5|nr:hypothetical protein [Archangium violaceum]QRK04839.1 hypothetical protein JQX13_32060 [Archangium violaceum]
MQLAPQQPDQHGSDKSKVLLVTRPKGNVDTLVSQGHETERNAVEVTYTLLGQQAKDTLNVKVHRFGCSRVTWQRSGKANLQAGDQLAVCTHRATPQWNGEATWTAPPGGTDVGVVDLLEPGGAPESQRPVQSIADR